MNRRILIVAAAALALAGCEEKEKEKELVYIPSGEYVSIGIGGEGRTSIDIDRNVTWTKGDAFGMFCAQTKCANVKVDVPDEYVGQKSAFVTTNVQYNAAGNDHIFYMYYPYNYIENAKNDQTTVSARLKTQQTGLLRDVAFTMAKCEVKKPAAGERWGRINATFHIPFSYIRFCVKDAGHETGYRKINNVYMEAITASKVEGSDNLVDASTIQTDNSAIFCGAFTADLVSQTVTFDPNDVGNTIYVNPDVKPAVVDGSYPQNSGYDLNESILMLINSANFGNAANKYFRITFSFTDGTVGYAIKQAKEFQRNKVYNYGFKYENLNFGVENTIRVWPWTTVKNEITFD